jgi:hypothetical protein
VSAVGRVMEEGVPPEGLTQAPEPEPQPQPKPAPESHSEPEVEAGGVEEEPVDGVDVTPRSGPSRGSMRRQRRGSVDLLLGIGKNIVQQATGNPQPSAESDVMRESSLTNKALARAGSSPELEPGELGGQQDADEQQTMSDEPGVEDEDDVEEEEEEDEEEDEAEEHVDPNSWLMDEVPEDGDLVPGTPVPSWVITADGLAAIKASALLSVAEHCGWKKLESKKKKGVFEEWWFVLVQDAREGVLLLAQYESPEALAPTAVLKLEPGQFTVSPPKEKRSEMHCWRCAYPTKDAALPPAVLLVCRALPDPSHSLVRGQT